MPELAPASILVKPGIINNFDLLRLLAALQVVFHHTLTYFGFSKEYPSLKVFHEIITYFPGVPVFFTISGFLVYWSFERNQHQVWKYFRNRAFRIFPALWVCLAVTMALIFYFNSLGISTLLRWEFWTYLFCQATMFQSYFPPLSPAFGNGIPNGALWTIAVELQFYLLTPLIFFIVNKNSSRSKGNWRLLAIFIASYSTTLFARGLDIHSDAHQIAFNCALPYLFNFLFGIIIYHNFSLLKNWLEGKFLYWLAAYIAIILISKMDGLGFYNLQYWPLPGTLPGMAVLSMLIISATYTRTGLSKKLLRGNDISYGVYIYHLLVINALVAIGFNQSLTGVFLTVLAGTILLATLSWKLVEQKILLKK